MLGIIPHGTPSRVTVYLGSIILRFVENVDLLLIAKEHLRKEHSEIIRYKDKTCHTIMALTWVLPTWTIEPGFWADANWEEAASPRASQATGGNIV
jgi:hypothetical protein